MENFVSHQLPHPSPFPSPWNQCWLHPSGKAKEPDGYCELLGRPCGSESPQKKSLWDTMNSGLIYILGLLKEIKPHGGMIINQGWEGFFFVFMPMKLNCKFGRLQPCEKMSWEKARLNHCTDPKYCARGLWLKSFIKAMSSAVDYCGRDYDFTRDITSRG